VNISAGNLTIQGSSQDFTGIDSSANKGSGGSGGDAGTVIVNAETLDITNHGKISSETSTTGKAGSVIIDAKILGVIDGGAISSSTSGEGNAGSVLATSDKLTLDGGYITSNADTGGKGNAGLISIKAGILAIQNGGGISSNTYTTGNAGNVTVSADKLTIDSQGFTQYATGIVSGAISGSGGDAGTVTVNAKILDILNSGVVSSSSQGFGDAGTVTVTSDNLTIDGQGSIEHGTGVFSTAQFFSFGQAGNINITSSSIRLFNSGTISIANNAIFAHSAEIIPSTLTITAQDIDMKNSSISSQANWSIAAGNIIVNAANRLNMDNSFINTTANTGDGGTIKINGGDLIYLQNSGFKTTVSGEKGNGGDISVKAEMLVMDTGLIQANAKSGHGGNIDLALQALIPSAYTLIKGGKFVEWNSSPSTINVIQAASQTGVNGTVTNSAPQLNLSGVLANVGNSNFDKNLISQDYCALGKGSSLAKKGKGGLPLRAKDLQVR
jgi:large exoprotein involved in heme utilization and adhesion